MSSENETKDYIFTCNNDHDYIETKNYVCCDNENDEKRKSEWEV